MRPRSLLIAIPAFLLLLLTTSTPAAPAAWKAGTAKIKITPDIPIWMSGYAHRDKPAEGKLTDLWAKCLALQSPDGNHALLITLDLVGISREFSTEVASQISDQFHIPRDSILLSSSHTHTGPVVGNNLQAMYFYDDSQEKLVHDYSATLKVNLINLAGMALAGARPASLAHGTGRCRFAVNRRNNPEPQIEQLRQSGEIRGPVDHDVPILAVRDQDDLLRAIVCGYACHATVLSSYQWSGDWPGFAQIALEERHPGTLALVWAGCGADQNPLPRRTVELARTYGNELADAVDRVLEQKLKPIGEKFTALYAEIDLPFARLPSQSELEDSAKSTDRYQARRAKLLLNQLRLRGTLPPTYPYPVQTWRFSNGPNWIALGGEVVVDYSIRLKAELGDGQTWVMSYANDVMAYIPSERVLAEGGYEGGGSMVYYGQPSPWASGIEDRIITEVHRQLSPSALTPTRIYPNHEDLWVYLDQLGRPQMVKSEADWKIRRTQILAGFQEATGPLPNLQSFPPLDVQIHHREPTDNYDRLRVSYQTEPGNRVSAFLLLPHRLRDKAPAMLCLHQTVAIGKSEPIGQGGKPNLRYAHELALRGYVCIAPDYPSFGDSKSYDFNADSYPSGTIKGVVNHIRAVDLLSQRPEVDPERIGVIGHSLGGHNAMFVGVFDPRLKVIVSSCGWTPFHDYYEGKIEGWTSDRYMPRLRTTYALNPDRLPFDFYEIVAALAPRAFFSNSPLQDHNFAVSGVKKAATKANALYAWLGAPDQIQIRYPNCSHDFPPEVREEAYRFIDRVLALQKPY